VFGGSTVWGTGARDDGTIPSWLARISDEQGRRYAVTNLGESGFVSWQEALSLADKCASGDVPDIAVFYDGVNDVFAKLQSPDELRPPQNLARSSRWFAAFRDKYVPLDGVVTFYARNSLLMTLLDEMRAPSFTEAEAEGGAERLAQAIAQEHAQTRAFVRALADDYGFEVVYVWQPAVFTKEPLTDEEQAYAENPGEFPPALLDATYRLATRAVTASGEVVDASDVFDGMTDTTFIDWMHVSEAGNRKVAELIVEQLSFEGVATKPTRGRER
jgi:hypothetical protein